MERVGDIQKIKELGIDDEAEMAINCEWVRGLRISTQGIYLTQLLRRVPLTRLCMNTFHAQSTTSLLTNLQINQANKRLRSI
jgi:hypothetical protein